MRSDPVPAKPSLAPLRAVSDVLDDVEVDVESIQRDLVLAERAGLLALVVGGLTLAGVVTLLLVRRSKRRSAAPPAPTVPADRPPDDAPPTGS